MFLMVMSSANSLNIFCINLHTCESSLSPLILYIIRVKSNVLVFQVGPGYSFDFSYGGVCQKLALCFIVRFSYKKFSVNSSSLGICPTAYVSQSSRGMKTMYLLRCSSSETILFIVSQSLNIIFIFRFVSKCVSRL